MPLPLIPIAIVSLGGFFGWKAIRGRKMKPTEQKIFDEAFHNLRDPAKLEALAKTFDDEGFKKEATQLRKRAALRHQPPEVYKARRAAFDKAMAIKDPKDADTVIKMAAEFEKLGAIGAADALRKYANTLKAV